MTRDFATLFTEQEKRQPKGKILLGGAARNLTYGQIADETRRFYSWCIASGLQPGDRAVILTRDDIALTSLFFGCLRYGLTAVIVSQDSGKLEQENLIAAAKPAALFMDADYFGTLKLPAHKAVLRITPRGGMPSFIERLFGKKQEGDLYPASLFMRAPEQNPAPVPLDATAYILFTSGTTSRPKGVEITHGNLLAQMNTFVRHYGYTSASRLLNILPLHHTDGLTQGPVVAFVAGCGVFRPLRFSITEIPALINATYRLRISHFIAVPTMLQLIDGLSGAQPDAFRTGDFKFIISTAGYLDPNLWARFEKRFTVMIVNVYGLTETVCEALYCGPSPETRKLGTIGKPVDTECRIVSEDGKDAANGAVGELWLKGPHIMKGYFEMPNETAEVLTKDGWFKTGDLCKRDEDGFYHIAGRKKNVIISGGMNIYPEDVANILRNLPGVIDAAVWGEDDATWGETVAAAIILKPGANQNEQSVAQAFAERAAAAMAPRRIHIVADFPRGPAGKVIVRDLRAAIASKQDHNLAHAGNDLMQAVLGVAAQSFKCAPENLSLESTAETVKGWNSLAHVEFLLSLEKEFGIKIGPKEILSVRSLGDALRIVREKAQAA